MASVSASAKPGADAVSVLRLTQEDFDDVVNAPTPAAAMAAKAELVGVTRRAHESLAAVAVEESHVDSSDIT